jgi:uncharacterized membrane protein (DUF2068 family)
MTKARLKLHVYRKPHNQWLVLIAVFKLAQAALLIAIGVGARHLLHKDVADWLETLARHLRFNPEWHFVTFILRRSELVNDQILRRFSIALFSYAALGTLEGIGLYLEKVWAEYLTLAISASFLPWELLEMVRKVTIIRVSLFAINLLVFLYLLKLVSARLKWRWPRA